MENPFFPCAAATVNIDVSSSSQRVQVTQSDETCQVRIQNNGTATVWLNAGGAAVTAALASGFPVGPGVTEVLTFDGQGSAGLYIAAIAAGSTGKVYFTPGTGI